MIITLYRLFLKLYPADFRADFEDEMVDTFTANLHDRHNIIGIVIKELLDGLWQAFLLHVHASKQWYVSLSDERQTIYQARWIIRIGSMLTVLFLVLVTLESYTASQSLESLAFLTLFVLQLICVFFALRWERIGGIIMLTTTLTIAPMIFFSTLYPGYELLSLLGTVLWASPFGSFAIGYLVLGRREYVLTQGAIA